jgi:hypothetical protein
MYYGRKNKVEKKGFLNDGKILRKNIKKYLANNKIFRTSMIRKVEKRLKIA